MQGFVGFWQRLLDTPRRRRHRRKRHRQRLEALHRNAVYLGDHRCLTTTHYGYKMLLDSRDLTLTPHVLLDGVWERDVSLRLLASLRPGMRAVEVGCNVGWHTLLIAGAVGPEGRVIGFEPHPDLHVLAHDNIVLNGLTERVTLYDMAVGNFDGETSFFLRGRHRGNSSLARPGAELLERYHDTQEEIRVRAVALDHLLQGDDRRIDLLKVDVEGAEPLVFQGMRQLLEENEGILIIMEWCPAQWRSLGQDAHATLASLNEMGFTFCRIAGGGRLAEETRQTLASVVHCDLLLSRRPQRGLPSGTGRSNRA